jgi:hypothetical protein
VQALAARVGKNEFKTKKLPTQTESQQNLHNFVEARNSLSAAGISTSENPLKSDQDAQKIIQCGQFLAQMFASGRFQNKVSCR